MKVIYGFGEFTLNNINLIKRILNTKSLIIIDKKFTESHSHEGVLYCNHLFLYKNFTNKYLPIYITIDRFKEAVDLLVTQGYNNIYIIEQKWAELSIGKIYKYNNENSVLEDINNYFIDTFGRYVLITGASSGLGLHLTKFFNNLGAKLILINRKKDKE